MEHTGNLQRGLTPPFFKGRFMDSESHTTRQSERGIWLSTGFHETPEEGMSIMECVAYVCGEEHSSYPLRACPVISELVRDIADHASDRDRQTLVQFILPIACSVASEEVTHKRLFYCVDFVARTLAPDVLTYFCRIEEARALQKLSPIRDTRTAQEAHMALRTLFLSAYLNPTHRVLSRTYDQLVQLVDHASKVLSSDGDALTVLLMLKAALARFESQADSYVANMIFERKRVLLENVLCIGPNLPVQPEVLTLRRQRLERLERKMSVGSFGRAPGSKSER